MEEFEVHSMQDYLDVIQKMPIDFCLSRGQASDYSLLPSALRKDEGNHNLYSKSTITCFMEDFKLNSVQYIEDVYNVRSEYEWLVYAQHFGVPTQLLDFTYSHIISLMFAVEKAFSYGDDDNENSVVWFLNANKLNEYSINRKEIINLSNENDIKLSNKEYPVVVSARKINNRIFAQNGLFVYFQTDSIGLESLTFSKEILKKVKIPHSYSKNIMKDLYLLGMRFNNIYPELASVSKDILLKNSVMEYLRMEE